MQWRECHHRSGEPVWINLALARRIEGKVQPEPFTRIVFDANDHVDVRETPDEITAATPAAAATERSAAP